MRFLSLVILFLFCSLSLFGDAVIVIKGKNRRHSLKLTESSGSSARAKRYNGTTEVSTRVKKQPQSAKLTFKVTDNDEFSFSLGGGYIRKEGSKKNDFEWIDCSLFKVNGQELIGPNAGKDGKKKETLSRPKPVKGGVKVKKGDTLTLEFTLRATPRKEARKLESDSKMSKRRKERLKQKEEKKKGSAEDKGLKDKKSDGTGKGADSGKQQSNKDKGKAEPEQTAEQLSDAPAEEADE